MIRRFSVWMVALMLCLMVQAAQADVLTLPAGTKVIEDQAFYGCAAVTEAILPEGVEEIGSEAFVGTGLTRVVLPSSLRSICPDAFEGCEGLVAEVRSGSYAEAFCEENGIETYNAVIYRALIVGEAQYASAALKAPPYDAAGVSHMLGTMSATPYASTLSMNLDSTSMLSAIRSTFADADENDVSLFYYAGHGESAGILKCVDNGRVTPVMLRRALDQVSGKKIVIIDACFSGGLIGRSADGNGPSSFVNGFMSAFCGLTSRSEDDLADSGYYVITGCRSYERTYELSYDPPYGLFTYWLNTGAGWDQRTGTRLSMAADVNADSLLTLTEMGGFAREHVNQFLDDYNATYGTSITSVVQIYYEDEDIVVCGR